MDKKIRKHIWITAIANIINGILGLTRTNKGFSIFMILIGILCLTADLIDLIISKKEEDEDS